MKIVIEPTIAAKIEKMKQRVRWQEPAIVQRGIDQTRLSLEDGRNQEETFSFLVIGDSGSGARKDNNPQRHIADQMARHRESCRFILHTGDVVYLSGSREFYQQNFIRPYHHFLVGGERPEQISLERLLFSLPMLTVPGNHDYYDLPWYMGWAAQLAQPLRYLIAPERGLDLGWQGSNQGQTYAQAFLDYLMAMPVGGILGNHLDRYYTATAETGRCLRYEPGRFTRLPNRYYTFRYGGIDFFALDSNTFNAPTPIPDTPQGRVDRRQLEDRLEQVKRQQQRLLQLPAKPNSGPAQDREQFDDLRSQWQQLEEVQRDLEKQLKVDETTVTDMEQLSWLRQRLIDSWRSPDVRGRVLFFHHPPYVTEASKWDQGQTLAVRQRLRSVLDDVAAEIGDLAGTRPIVDLVLNGHAHCLEYLKTENTKHADAKINWIVCGGSGYSLRRQRREGPKLYEMIDGVDQPVATSQLFVGRSGMGVGKHRPYSFLRIDVQPGNPPQFVVRPYISDWYQRRWVEQELEPLLI